MLVLLVSRPLGTPIRLENSLSKTVREERWHANLLYEDGHIVMEGLVEKARLKGV